MYSAEKGYTPEYATEWLKYEDGKWLPDSEKGTAYIKWFHDGVLRRADPGGQYP